MTPTEDQPTQLYRHYDSSGRLLYVGISNNHIARLGQHRDAAQWFHLIDSVKIEHFKSRAEALEAERQAIQNEDPKYNIQHKKRVNYNDVSTPETTTKSRNELIRRVVDFRPVYTISEAAEVLLIGKTELKRMCDNNEIGTVVMGHTNAGRYGPRPRIRITGWQLIDFLDSLGGVDGHDL